MDILEVGQIWEATLRGTKEKCTYEILKLTDLKVFYFFTTPTNDGGCDYRHRSLFVEERTLITTADGKPYVKPNDYRAMDVWECVATPEGQARQAILIVTDPINDKLYWMNGYGSDPSCFEGTNLINRPQNYRLIYRDGKAVTND